MDFQVSHATQSLSTGGNYTTEFSVGDIFCDNLYFGVNQVVESWMTMNGLVIVPMQIIKTDLHNVHHLIIMLTVEQTTHPKSYLQERESD